MEEGLEKDLEDFDVSSPFLYTKKRPKLRPPSAINEELNIENTFDSRINKLLTSKLLKYTNTFSDTSLKTFDFLSTRNNLYTETTNQEISSNEIEEQKNKEKNITSQEFYLRYLEYFVFLQVKFRSLSNEPKTVTQKREKMKYENMREKIIQIIQEKSKLTVFFYCHFKRE